MVLGSSNDSCDGNVVGSSNVVSVLVWCVTDEAVCVVNISL